MTPLLIACLLAQAVSVAPRPEEPSGPRLRMREVFWGDRYGHLHHRSVPFLGDRPVEGIELYRVLGRPDLVAEYEHHETFIEAMAALGSLAAVSGVIGAVVYSGQRSRCQRAESICDASPALGALSVVGILGGGMVMAVAAASSPDPLSDAQKRALVEKVGQHGGPRPPRSIALQPGASVTSHGAVLGLVGSF